jgi:DNA topoisomerase-1
MVPFGAALPALRERVERDLALRGLPREKVLAAVLHLIDVTLMRVGNDEYARLNASFGASTMRNEHAEVRRGQVLMSFRGKHGRDHAVRVADRRLARIVRRCQDLPGEELFGYLDELGTERDVRSEDVNEYVRELAGQDFTVKDFRTWGASVLAAGLLGEIGTGQSEAETTRLQNAAIRVVAHDLGNTPAVCRSSYIHPLVLETFRAGSLEATRLEAPAAIDGLRETEAYVLDLLGAA